MNDRHKRFLNYSIVGLVALAFVMVFFGPFGITGFASVSSITTTAISFPANSAEVKQGDTFTVSAVVGCKNSQCSNVVTRIAFVPGQGLVLASGYKNSVTIGKMAPGATKTVSWLVKGSAQGNYGITVSTTSGNAAQTNALVNVLVYVPACNSNSDCGTSGYSGNGYCGADGIVYRMYASSTCINAGTSSAACSVTTSPVAVLNCGVSGYSGSAFCSADGNLYQMYTTSGCSNGACSNYTAPLLKQACNYGCANGACLGAPDSCSDSDGGYAISVQGTVSGVNGGAGFSNAESCASASALSEFYCNGQTKASTQVNCGSSGYSGALYCLNNSVYRNYVTAGCSIGACFNSTAPTLQKTCASGCLNGACITAPADSCYDSDGGFVVSMQGAISGYKNGVQYANQDSCASGASITEFYCNGVSALSLNASCGQSGLTGSTYCQNNSVYGTYVTAGCSSGACYNATSGVLIQPCSLGCSAGNCINST